MVIFITATDFKTFFLQFLKWLYSLSSKMSYRVICFLCKLEFILNNFKLRRDCSALKYVKHDKIQINTE